MIVEKIYVYVEIGEWLECLYEIYESKCWKVILWTIREVKISFKERMKCTYQKQFKYMNKFDEYWFFMIWLELRVVK